MRFAFLFLLSLAYWLQTPLAATETPPNILFILVDDLGREGIGATGGTSYKTPNVDALAAGGLVFDYAFSTPKCSPSRVTLLTGRYTFRSTRKWGHIPRSEVSFATQLQKAGYATAIAGKWQLGRIVDDPEALSHFGFQRSCVWGWHEGPRYWNPTIWQDGAIRKDVTDRYGPEVYTEFLIDFMRENRTGPFLAYYPMCLPHFPKSNEPKGPSGSWETFPEMVTHMDRAVERLVTALDDLGIRKQTLILFSSDNGSPTNVEARLNGKVVKGGKASLTDAGTRVPFIVNWPGTIAAGRRSDTLVDFSDPFPTFIELAGAALPADRVIDGKSFAWALRGETHAGRDWVWTEWAGNSWIRSRDWKLYAKGQALFDMRDGGAEDVPVSPYSQDPIAQQMRTWLGSEAAELLAPAKP